ncbi:hypothetical protein [Streptomyces alboflavus]|uniref:hypothetical protein n=1 Tax=Streptomyces alboflavus TaxID=67267 RepID=UPI0004C0A64A|nr:hypothetical protein [Streptomyces alboflavus]
MRKTVTGIALVTAAALLTGCSDDGEGGDAKGGKGDKGSHSSASKHETSKWGAPQSHEVTLEVKGKGQPSLGWMADTNHFENRVTLPWTKTVKVTLEGAELKSGRLLEVSAQGVPGPDGLKYVFPPCAIKVDGKIVDKSDGGEKKVGCEYRLKGS